MTIENPVHAPLHEPQDETDVACTHAALVARLFREHNEALLRFLALRLGSQQEANEVAQESYVRLLKLEEPGAISFLRTFLFTIAANIAKDRMRTRQRQPRSVAAMFEEFRAAPPSPEQELAGQQELAIVRGLIAQLPPKCRRVFLLQRVNGLSTAAIAAQMDLSERMVRHYILRAVTTLRVGLDAATSADMRTTAQENSDD